jgi:N-carbamoyl-L-amino-acid hydrolase
MIPYLDGEQLLQDLETLAQFGAEPGPGLNRVAFSPADQEGRDWVEAEMRAAGMAARRDPAGNSIGRYPGQEAELPPIVLGSHTDTVPNGGRYDGALGVLAALSCVRSLHQAGMTLRHPVEVINFAAEEATMSGATLGSQAMAGLLNLAVVEQMAWDGLAVGHHLQGANIDLARLLEARRPAGSIAAFLELHIEQGGALEQAGIPIGVVEGIVGIRRYDVVFEGVANHAGTTPMALRRDALVMAAPFITGAREIALQHEIVATIGALRVHPGAPNVIPGRVDLQLEIRGLDEAALDQAQANLATLANALDGQFSHRSAKGAVKSDSRLVEALEAACKSLKLAYRVMPSGAGHDAMCMADIAPQAMLFVPSRGGVSHAPDEYTAPEDCVNGARVLLAALLELDARL